MLEMWDVSDVGCWRCGMLEMWDVGDVGCGGCGMWDVWDVGCSGCGMFGMWDVRDVGCSGCGMFGMWDVGCLLGCGMLIYKMPFRMLHEYLTFFCFSLYFVVVVVLIVFQGKQLC